MCNQNCKDRVDTMTQKAGKKIFSQNKTKELKKLYLYYIKIEFIRKYSKHNILVKTQNKGRTQNTLKQKG